MDEILLFLTLKYNGNWMKIYNGLQNREKILIDELKNIYQKIKCEYITIIDNKYPDSLKQIYKPSFGLFYKGNFELLNERLICISGEINNENKWLIKELANLNLIPIFINLSDKKLKFVRNICSYNVFYNHEFLNKNYNNFIDFIDCKKELVLSEIYQKSNNSDYEDQIESRVYLGISRKIFIINKINDIQFKKIITFANEESSEIYILKNVFNLHYAEQGLVSEIKIIENIQDMWKFLEIKN